jgi:hypothetical protein
MHSLCHRRLVPCLALDGAMRNHDGFVFIAGYGQSATVGGIKLCLLLWQIAQRLSRGRFATAAKTVPSLVALVTAGAAAES